MHNLFLVYFINLYMFRAYLGLSSGGKTVCSSNPTRKTDSRLKRIISTNCCTHTVVPPDDGSRYARNMYRLTKYRVSIKSFPDYKQLLQENYVEYIFLNVTQIKKFFYSTLVHFNMCSFCCTENV